MCPDALISAASGRTMDRAYDRAMSGALVLSFDDQHAASEWQILQSLAGVRIPIDPERVVR